VRGIERIVLLSVGLGLFGAAGLVAQEWYQQQTMKRSDPILFCDRFNSSAFFSVFGDQGFKKKATLVEPVTSGKGFVTLSAAERQFYTSGKPVEVRRKKAKDLGSQATIKKDFQDFADSDVPVFIQVLGTAAALTPASIVEKELLDGIGLGQTALDVLSGLGSDHRTKAAVLAQVYVDDGALVESGLRYGPAGKEFLEQVLSYQVRVGNEVKTWFLCSTKIAIKP
jgi:hypothetical protein